MTAKKGPKSASKTSSPKKTSFTTNNILNNEHKGVTGNTYFNDAYFEKQKKADRRIARNAWIGIIIFFSLVALFFRNTSPTIIDYDMEGYVNIFPKGSEAKNYRLKALIDGEADPQLPFGTYKETFRLKMVYWPNGGTTSFTDGVCEIGSSGVAECTDDELRVWKIIIDKDTIKS